MGKVKLGKALAKKLDDFLKEMEVQYKLKPEDTEQNNLCKISLSSL